MKYKLLKFIVNFLSKLLEIKWDDKLISKNQVDYVTGLNNLFLLSRDVPGHILELGTGKGRNGVIFGSLIKTYRQEQYKNFFGFDSFSGYPDDVLEKNQDFSSTAHVDNSLESVQSYFIKNRIDDVAYLIQGNINTTLPSFVKSDSYKFRSGMLLVSLLYIDCNDYETALSSLKTLQPFLSNGCVIAVDECTMGGETKALLEFANNNNLDVKTGDLGGVISSYLIYHS